MSLPQPTAQNYIIPDHNYKHGTKTVDAKTFHAWNLRKSLQIDYYALANEHEVEWLGPKVKRARIHTWWQCQRGHKWQTTYVSIRSGSGCPICGQERRVEYLRKKPVDYHAVAKRRGFEWLGPEVPNVATKTWWRCSGGHEWETTYAVIRQGHGCPICHHLYHRGEKHHCWQGGKSSESYSSEFDIKRERVRNRDGNTCQVCDDPGDLCVHHIDYDKKNNSDENLITLCRSCHGKTNFNRRFWQIVLSWKVRNIR